MIKDLISTMSARDRHKEKSKALANVKLTKVDKYDIESISEENGLLKVIVKGQGKRNPFYFKNPPIMVPDGEGFKEDHEEALKQILLQTLNLK